MFRLSNLIPRLILLSVLALSLCLCVNPLVHYQLVRIGRQTTGADVEIGRVRTSIRDRMVHLENVQAADPLSPWNNLLEFAEGQFRLDASALLRRRLVVSEGFISGVRIGGRRVSSGSLGGAEPDSLAAPREVELPADNAASLGGAEWLDLITGRYDEALEERLESYRTAQQLTRQWPDSYQQLSDQAAGLRERLRRIQETARAEGENPLRYVPAYKEAYQQLARLRDEIRGYHDEIEGMRQRTDADRAAIEEARQRDLDALADAFDVEELDADRLSEHLLRRETVRLVQDWLTLVRDGRELLQRIDEAPRFDLAAGRGQHLFQRGDQPDYQIRRLAFDGQGTLGRQPFHFLGVAENITNQPQLQQQPTAIRLSAAAPTPMEIEVVLNHGGADAADHLRVSCPSLPMRQRVLGDPQHLALNVAAGVAEVWLELHLVGDQIDGELRIKEPDAAITPHVAARESRKLENLQLAVGEIHGLQSVATLSGTLYQPGLSIRSNLGPQLTQGLGLAMAREIENRRRTLIARTRELVNEEMRKFDEAVAAARDAVLEDLALSEKAVSEYQDELASRLGDAFYIFETGPQFDNLLRR